MSERKPRAKCLSCQKEVVTTIAIYCSNTCQKTHQYQRYIEAWKRGEVTGIKAGIELSGYLRRYIFEKYAGRCSMCGWDKQNPVTGRVPLEVDHIDGNWLNNQEENLRLLCPNCHSLTPTYKSLNKGKGRVGRK